MMTDGDVHNAIHRMQLWVHEARSFPIPKGVELHPGESFVLSGVPFQEDVLYRRSSDGQTLHVVHRDMTGKLRGHTRKYRKTD